MSCCRDTAVAVIRAIADEFEAAEQRSRARVADGCGCFECAESRAFAEMWLHIATELRTRAIQVELNGVTP